MSYTSINLEERATLLKKLNGVVSAAEKESRGLTQGERALFEHSSKRVKELNGLLEVQTERDHQTELADARNENRGSVTTPGETRYGRAMDLEQRFRDLPGANQIDGVQANELDLGRLIRGHVTGSWQGADAELRAVQAIGTGSLGGNIVPTPLASEILDLARNKAMVLRAGAKTVAMETNTLDYGTLSGDPTAYWRAESVAITASNATFGTHKLTAKVCSVLLNTTIEFLEDAPNAGQVLRDAMAMALSLELDRVCIHGSGSGSEPEGVLNTTGIGSQSMGTDGAVLAGYSQFIAALADVREANYEPSGALYSPRTQAALASLVDTTNNPLVVPKMVSDVRQLVTGQVSDAMTQGASSVASAIVVGEWNKLILGMRNELVFEAFRSGDSSLNNVAKMEVSLRAYIRADVLVSQPTAFSSVIGIIPS